MTAPDERAAYIAGIRKLADVLESRPDLPLPSDGSRKGLPLTWSFGFIYGDPKAAMAAAVRLLPCDFAKEYRDEGDPMLAKLNLNGRIEGLHVRLTAYRDLVCTMVVTGTREITEDVPDPEELAKVPVKSVTRVVEDVEWTCGPILAPAEDAS